jgi:hypothetical protein
MKYLRLFILLVLASGLGFAAPNRMGSNFSTMVVQGRDVRTLDVLQATCHTARAIASRRPMGFTVIRIVHVSARTEGLLRP